MAAEITVATRLVIVCNPNNPTSTALPLDRHRRVRRAGPAPRLRDPRRGLLRVQLLDDPDATLDLLERHPNLVLLRTFSQGLRARAGCASASGCAASEELRQRGRPGPPAVLLQRRRPGRGVEALKHRTRSPSASSARSPARSTSRTGCARSGSRSPSRRRTSCGSTSRRTPTRTTVVRGLSPSAACSCARARRSAGPGALRVTLRHAAENERFLGAGELLPSGGGVLARTSARMAERTAHRPPRQPPPAVRVLPLAFATSAPGDLARRSAGAAAHRPRMGPRAERRKRPP